MWLHDIFQVHISLALKKELQSKQVYPHFSFACDKVDKQPCIIQHHNFKLKYMGSICILEDFCQIQIFHTRFHSFLKFPTYQQ